MNTKLGISSGHPETGIPHALPLLDPTQFLTPNQSRTVCLVYYKVEVHSKNLKAICTVFELANMLWTLACESVGCPPLGYLFRCPLQVFEHRRSERNKTYTSRFSFSLLDFGNLQGAGPILSQVGVLHLTS